VLLRHGVHKTENPQNSTEQVMNRVDTKQQNNDEKKDKLAENKVRRLNTNRKIRFN